MSFNSVQPVALYRVGRLRRLPLAGLFQPQKFKRQLMQIIGPDKIAELLDYRQLTEALRTFHRMAPPETHRLVIDDPGTTGNKFALLFGWAKDIAVAKMVGIFPGNPGLPQPLPTTPGLVAAFDAGTGTPLAVIDGPELTYRKTAADSALGSLLLSPEDAGTLLVVGAGGLAPHMAEAHLAVRPSIKTILFWNRTPERAVRLAAATEAWLNTRSRALIDLDEAVAQADIISCVTMSDRPLVQGRYLRPSVHLDLVGAFLPTMREADDEAVLACTKFADLLEGALGAGDFAQLINRGLMTAADVQADLFGLCAEGSMTSAAQRPPRTLFKNNGGGHLDLYVARHLLEMALRK